MSEHDEPWMTTHEELVKAAIKLNVELDSSLRDSSDLLDFSSRLAGLQDLADDIGLKLRNTRRQLLAAIGSQLWKGNHE